VGAIDRKNIGLAVLFAALALVCGAILSPYFFWELVDIENHTRAHVTYVLAVLMFLMGAFSLNAFVSVLRFGFVRDIKGVLGILSALAAFVLRAVLAFLNVNLLWFSVMGMIDTRGALEECIGTLFFLAVMLAGYRVLYWLSKKLRAERALRVTFDE